MELMQVYDDNKELIRLISTNKQINNALRLTNLKGDCCNIDNVYQDFLNNKLNNSIVSGNDLLKSINNIKNSYLWEAIKAAM